VTQEQRPFLPSTPKADSIRQRADGRRVSWESISDWQQRPGTPFTPTSDEAPSKVNTLQVIFLGVHITMWHIGSVHPGRNSPKRGYLRDLTNVIGDGIQQALADVFR